MGDQRILEILESFETIKRNKTRKKFAEKRSKLGERKIQRIHELLGKKRK